MSRWIICAGISPGAVHPVLDAHLPGNGFIFHDIMDLLYRQVIFVGQFLAVVTVEFLFDSPVPCRADHIFDFREIQLIPLA